MKIERVFGFMDTEQVPGMQNTADIIAVLLIDRDLRVTLLA